MIALIKDNLGEKNITKCFGWRPKTYSYLKVYGSSEKKQQVQKMHKDYQNCLKKNVKMLKLHQELKNEAHNVLKEKINNIALGSNDKNLTFNKIASHPYGTNARKIFKLETLEYLKIET